jgi:hypothetical protein
MYIAAHPPDTFVGYIHASRVKFPVPTLFTALVSVLTPLCTPEKFKDPVPNLKIEVETEVLFSTLVRLCWKLDLSKMVVLPFAWLSAFTRRETEEKKGSTGPTGATGPISLRAIPLTT